MCRRAAPPCRCTGPVIINEVLTSPAGKLESGNRPANFSWVTVTNATEWFELRNSGSGAADLSGWSMTGKQQKEPGEGEDGADDAAMNDDGGPPDDAADSWQFPNGTVMPAGGLLVVLCPRAKAGLPAAPTGSNLVIAHKLKVSSSGLQLKDSTGKLMASTGRLPKSMPGVSVGLPLPPSGAPGSAPYTWLTQATPWLPNTAANKAYGPFIWSVKHKPKVILTANQSVTITAALSANQAAIGAVTLKFRVNFTPEQAVPMIRAQVAATQRVPGDSANPTESFSATIPAGSFKPGDMVRWRVQAQDAAGGVTFSPPGVKAGEPLYKGTVIPLSAVEANSTVPVLYWFAEDPGKAQSKDPGGISSIFWNGTFYDSVISHRRGVSTLGWLKPKMTFSGPKKGFRVLPGITPSRELKLNALYWELGELSFLKEVVAYQVMEAEGVLAPLSLHVQVYLNGRFVGLYELVENVEPGFLSRFGLPKDGPIFKAVNGELANLRWDLPAASMPAYYGKAGRKSVTSDWDLLANFTKGLAGGGAVNRTSFLYDSLNLPAVINEAAVQTLLANMDRCTKNFYVYLNPDTEEWFRIAWDVEASMGQDNGLGGSPGSLYCILACEQWNSPLYCDSEHPQDIGNIETNWGLVTAVGLNTFTGPVGSRSLSGAAGTYNHLTDALLDVPSVRAMYMRRLQTLADKYYGRGLLKQIIDTQWAKISNVAAQDNLVWQRGDGSRGYQQLTTEFIPIRTKQLLQTYGPSGSNPLLPGPQDNSKVTMALGPVQLSGVPRSQSFISIVLRGPDSQAVDVSSWKLTKTSDGFSFVLPKGTVFPPGGVLYLSPDVKAFRSRSSTPKAGEAAFVIQVPDALLPSSSQEANDSSYTLIDEQGQRIQLGSG
eukprot:gene8887-9065_t